MKKFLSFIVLLCISVFSLSTVALSPNPCTRTAEKPCPKGYVCSGDSCVSTAFPDHPSNPSGPEKSPPEFKECSRRFSCTSNADIIEHGISCLYENGQSMELVATKNPMKNRSENHCKQYLGITDVKPKSPKDKFLKCYTEKECTKAGGTSSITKCCYSDHRTAGFLSAPKSYCVTESEGMSGNTAGHSERQCRSFLSNEERLKDQANALFDKHNRLRNDNEELREKNDRLTQQYGDLEKKCNALEELCSNTPSPGPVPGYYSGSDGGSGGNAGPVPGSDECPACNCPALECPPCSGTTGRRSGGASAVQ